MNIPDVVAMHIDDARLKIFDVVENPCIVIHECHSFKDKNIFPISSARVLKQEIVENCIHLYVGFTKI